MSRKHPILSITGSSGAGTSTVKSTFEQIFFRENISACFIEGDAFHRFTRKQMKAAMAEAEEAGNKNFSHFGPEANLFSELEEVFHVYSETGTGKTRHYVHDEIESELYGVGSGRVQRMGILPGGYRPAFLRGTTRCG